MKYFIILLFPLCSIKAQFLWQISPDTIIKWSYTDGDEFNKNSINTAKWHIGFPWGQYMYNTDSYVIGDNFTFTDGKANLIVKKFDTLVSLPEYAIAGLEKNKLSVEDNNKHRFKYTTALLWSKTLYKYGYFEIKFKGVIGQGIWPAFWLYGGHPNYEIDLFELKGENENKLHVNVHCPSGCADYHKDLFGSAHSWGHWIKLNKNLTSAYNIFAGEWGPDFIKYYLNGHLIAYARQNISTPMAVVVGTGAARDKWQFHPGTDKKTPFPNYFTIDYIRVFKQDTIPNTTAIRENLSENIDSSIINSVDLQAKASAKKIKFLPKGIKQNIKDKNTITISLLQQSKGSFSVRVLGASENNSAKITFLDGENKSITEFLFKDSGENIFLPKGYKVFQIQIEANNRITKETITLE